jgi:hypothetical protein
MRNVAFNGGRAQFLALLLMMSVCSTASAKGTLKMCRQLSDAINTRFPMRIDKYTVGKSTYCSDHPVKMNYVYVTEQFPLDISNSALFVKNNWCSNKGQLEVLSYFDVGFRYLNFSGEELGDFTLTEAQCR